MPWYLFFPTVFSLICFGLNMTTPISKVRPFPRELGMVCAYWLLCMVIYIPLRWFGWVY